MESWENMLLPDLATIAVSKKTTVRGGKRNVIQYLDIPVCFDIEAYSFMEGDSKRAVMWAWGLAIRDTCYIGRTWGDFLDCLTRIIDTWNISLEHRLIIWVHNLSYDFQFFHKWVEWQSVFALDSRTVCYALSKSGIEFRCSYILTGKSCEALGKSLISHSVKKLVGTIDYDLPRHPGTVLTETEVSYLEADCLVVTAHIEEQIEIEGGIAHIPLTHTGYCRRYVRKACFRDTTKKAKYDNQGYRYREFIAGLTMDSFIYSTCKRAFQGGFTHANPQYSRVTLDNITSLDVISDYPAQILANLYPVTPPEYISGFASADLFEEEIEKCCAMFTVELLDVESVINYDHYLSRSHCIIPEGATVQCDNGRIVRASHLITTICNVDYFIIRRCYKYKIKSVSGFIKWGWGYLPKPIIESTLYMYEQKTKLKGDPSKQGDYMLLKALLNSIYGMMVTDPLRDKIPYDIDLHEWGERREDGTVKFKVPLTDSEKLEALDKYNADYQRFTYYPWGVFITAYARHMLWSGILEFKDDYVYSDTDSIKCRHYEKHTDFINRYNSYMERKIEDCLRYYGIDPNRARPTNEKGEVKSLGTWDFDGSYNRFKTCGAKRYMIQEGSEYKITIAGVAKKSGASYIVDHSKETNTDPFDFFADGMEVPPGHAGKLIPTYGDEEISGVVTDYRGESYTYHELSYVHMCPGGYTMGLAPDYVLYLDLLQKGYI